MKKKPKKFSKKELDKITDMVMYIKCDVCEDEANAIYFRPDGEVGMICLLHAVEMEGARQIRKRKKRIVN